MNDLQAYANIFDEITPWCGVIPAGFTMDFMGNRARKEFLGRWGYHPAFVDGGDLQMERPRLANGENAEKYDAYQAEDGNEDGEESRDDGSE